MLGGGKTNRKYVSFPSMKRKQTFAHDNRVILLLNINKQACIRIVPCFQSKIIIISLHHAVINIQVVSVRYLKVTACTSTLEKCQIWNFLVNLVLQVSLLWLTGKMDAFKQQIPVHCSWKVLVPFKIHLALQSLIKLIGWLFIV